MNSVPITVGIPTYARGTKILATLERIAACSPRPKEIIVHLDGSDGGLDARIRDCWPDVKILASANRVGPGGGRHRCILAATQPLFVSFDDDSWPVNGDFFAEVVALFAAHERVAVLAATIFHPHESEPPPSSEVKSVLDYTGCGYALRIDAYRETTGHIDRYCPYGIEEMDLALQLHAAGWNVLKCRALRVFHDTALSHHPRAEIVAGTVQNAALLAFLRYPPTLWPHALLQVGNSIAFMLGRRRFAGLCRGVWGIPGVLRNYRNARRILPAAKVRSYLDGRRTVRRAATAVDGKPVSISG